MTEEQFISLFDVVEGDPNNKKLQTIQNEFIEMKSSLKTVMDAGLPPDEMKVTNMLYLAILAGMKILEYF